MSRAKSSDFSALARLVAIGGGNISQAAYLAESTKAPEAVRSVLKSAVDAGSLADPAFANALSDYGDVVGAFVESLRSRSVFARLLDGGMIRMPLRTRAAIATAVATAYARGEGLPIPISALSLAGPQLDERKAVGMVVVSNELLRSTSPAGRALLENALKAAVASAVDASFIDLVADGVTPATASGTAAADALTDLRLMLSAVNTTGAGSLFWVMAPDVANAGATLAAESGELLFPALSPAGGELLNLPALVSTSVLSGTLTLIDASGLAGEIGTVTVSIAQEATIQMDSAPSSPPNAASVMTSVWQTSRAAILATAYFGAERIREGSVAVLDGVDWGGTP